MAARFVDIARTHPANAQGFYPVSVFEPAPGTRKVAIGDTEFPIDPAGALLPDFIGRQLEWRRIGRHTHVEGFTLTDAGAELRYYAGQSPEPTAVERGELSPQLQAAIAELHAELGRVESTPPAEPASEPQGDAAAEPARPTTEAPIVAPGDAAPAGEPISTPTAPAAPPEPVTGPAEMPKVTQSATPKGGSKRAR